MQGLRESIFNLFFADKIKYIFIYKYILNLLKIENLRVPAEVNGYGSLQNYFYFKFLV